ncbi:TonB-dependent receptor [Fulvivirgaceae bacterium BMA10]|uniref:TonB-dependent receptor n=1 Tax=Splendidivirga corallicola TaxID=3051826 RepID=A0ABT8KW23_9BACT|nr:TonB-dependent receptor [Fulvivirgaceae bacterium BMA10]
MSKYAIFGIFIQCILYSLVLANSSEAQRVSIEEIQISVTLENASIKKAFQKIEKLTDFEFAYHKLIIDPNRRLDINERNISLADLLRSISKETNLRFKRVNNTIYVGSAEKGSNIQALEDPVSEEKTITGKVTDENGNGLPGVNVLVKDTNIGIVTNVDGNYKLIVPDDASILVFSYVGYLTEEVEIAGRTTIDFALTPDIETLSEVIVVGYGSKEKAVVSGSITQTSGAEIKTSPSVSLGASLAGRLSGVTINQRNGEPGNDGVSILVRGLSTTGNNSALIVVDGVANRDGIGRLDPDDIESITVLKDASAAIYGAQAAGGVILVTTKRGIEGKPTISYNYNHGFVSPTRLPDMADSYTYANAVNQMEEFAGRPAIFSDDDLQKYRDGSSPLTHPNTDWFDDLFEDVSHQSRQNLSVRGGSEKVKYFLSLGSASQDGLYKQGQTKYNQYNVRANVDAQISDNLQVSVDLAARREEAQSPAYSQFWIFWMALRQPPTEHAIFPNGAYSQGLASINPLALVRDSGYDRRDNDIVQGTLRFNYKIPQIEGLSLNGFFAVDNFNNFRKTFTTPWNYDVFDPGTNTYETFQSNFQGRISLNERFQRQTSITPHIRISYEKSFGDHNVGAFVAYEQNTVDFNENRVGRNAFTTPALDQISAGDADRDQFVAEGGASEFARKNYFGRLSYTYADKYILDFNWRVDGSVNFPEGDRFGFFPGVSAAWRISEEGFMQSTSFVQDLKLRASYGQLGNDRIGSFRYVQRFGLGTGYVLNGGVPVTGITIAGAPVENVTWETTETINLGLDASFLGGKLGLEFDVFKNKTRDMLIQRQGAVPDVFGIGGLPPENAGTMENKGFEVLLSYSDDFGEIGFNTSGNFSFAKNKVTFIDEADNTEAPWQMQTGYKLGRRLLYDAIGIYRTQNDLDNFPGLPGAGLGDLIYRDVNDDGIINGLDRIPIETNSTPEISFGLNTGITYKSFDLNVLLQGQARANQPVGYRFDGSGNVPQSQLEDTWSTDNTNASFPRVGQRRNYWAFTGSNFWLLNAAFLRIKTVELGYSLPSTVLNKVGLQNARVYISGFNLLTFSAVKDQDPEITSNEGIAHPQTKVINLGVKLTL